MGNISTGPTLKELYESPAARRIHEREEQVSSHCKDCPYLPICHGGCYYNALSTGDGVIDPLCEAYKRIYGFIESKLAEEVGSEENRNAILRRPARREENPLLRSGPYISLSDEVHPSRIAENAREILAAHALGMYGGAETAARRLVEEKICGNLPDTEDAMRQMCEILKDRPKSRNNCYLHVTFCCNLRCTHCYAFAGETDSEMPIETFRSLGEEAISLGFRQLVITGGEPLYHRNRMKLLEICRSLRGRGSNLVLRTNLTGQFSDEDLLAIASAFDQVVVSIDGNEETHDHRRGAGTYQNVTDNCIRYAALTKTDPFVGELSLACVMNAEGIRGEPGRSLQAFGDRLGVRRVRFRPLLPLGRAADMDEPVICEGLAAHELPDDRLRAPFRPLTTCGIGQNIYICPDGASYPCYAWHPKTSYLGNVASGGLERVLTSPSFTHLTSCTVDTIMTCRTCEYRYLCGGSCRAWGNQNATDLNATPPDCSHLQKKARELIEVARNYLDTD